MYEFLWRGEERCLPVQRLPQVTQYQCVYVFMNEWSKVYLVPYFKSGHSHAPTSQQITKPPLSVDIVVLPRSISRIVTKKEALSQIMIEHSE